MTFLLAPKKIFLFVLEVICPQYTFSLPDSGNCYFPFFSNYLPESDFYLPQAIGQVLM